MKQEMLWLCHVHQFKNYGIIQIFHYSVMNTISLSTAQLEELDSFNKLIKFCQKATYQYNVNPCL